MLVKDASNESAAPTVKYQLISKELHELAQKVEEKSREDKDVALAEFVRRHPKYLIIGLGHHGRIKIVFDRNMINYWKRCGEDVDRFREIFFLQSARRLYGSATELPRSSRRRLKR